MKRRTWIILGCTAAVLLIVVLACWRLIPKSAEKILSIREDATTRAACSALEAGVADGETYIHSYDIGTVRPTDAAYREIRDILYSTKYTPSLWNLTGLSNAISGNQTNNLNGMFVAQYVWGTDADYVVIRIYRHGEQVTMVANDRIYYPEDASILERLTQVVKTYNTK